MTEGLPECRPVPFPSLTQYLTPADVSGAAREIRELLLVRYRYKTQGDGVTPTVGILIEDVPGASFVDHETQRVNLNSGVSATAAATRRRPSSSMRSRCQASVRLTPRRHQS